MKKVELIAEGKGYTAVDMGSLDKIGEYSITHPKLKTEIFGKLFLKDVTAATGTEISFNTLPPKTEIPYFHNHTDNEETYLKLRREAWHYSASVHEKRKKEKSLSKLIDEVKLRKENR